MATELSTAAIVGICIGVVAFLFAILVLTLVWRRRRRERGPRSREIKRISHSGDGIWIQQIKQRNSRSDGIWIRDEDGRHIFLEEMDVSLQSM